ncbi:MAG: preprotein translocase subunit SecE, partial [Thermoanaerobacterium sp.]|nr:preprotein translocase subunit SecE [Thermoanaerobacterium sp.]
TWPTRDNLIAYTEVVLVVVIAFTLLIFLADSAFSYLLKLIIKS